MGLSCPLCQENYTTGGQLQPRLLIGCGHTFCQKCLNSRKMTDGRTECPQCSLISNEPHAPNITIMNYVDVQTAKPSQVTHHVPAPLKSMCQDCKQCVATVICFQCLPTGFRFCDTCSDREHSRTFAPMSRHAPRPIANVRFETPVPNCKTHTDKPCLYFSFKVNQFACEECRNICDFEKDKYMPIDGAVARIRDELPSLIQLIRERVDTIAHTRAQLDELLKRVDQERGKALDRVRVEFQQFEVAIKKQLSFIEQRIEEEAQFQKKALTVQMEKLEVTQGGSDTSVVQANMLLQMADYRYLQQAELIIGNIKSQLSEEDVPLYQGPVTEGTIPVHINPSFLDDIDKLCTVGGGAAPVRLTCNVESDSDFLVLRWEQTDPTVKEYEIQCEPMEEKDSDPLIIASDRYAEYRQKIQTPVKTGIDTDHWRLDGLMVGKKYSIRIRSRNTAGWGTWSGQVIGQFPDFPLHLGHTGCIVNLDIPCDGMYCITARGAKAADGETRKGGRGAIVEAKFLLNKYDTLIILCGGMSEKVGTSSGGGGGTFVALNRESQLLIAAGGGGGTRGHDTDDRDGRDANIEASDGLDGVGQQWASGGADGSAGKDALFTGPCWGYGGAGFNQASSTAKSFLHGGSTGEGGGFGGGGGAGHYGGGGGGGYSGGGGGRGGGGGGCFVMKEWALDERRSLGNDGYGFVTIVRVDND